MTDHNSTPAIYNKDQFCKMYILIFVETPFFHPTQPTRNAYFIILYQSKKENKKWNEMKWNEMKWNEMKLN